MTKKEHSEGENGHEGEEEEKSEEGWNENSRSRKMERRGGEVHPRGNQ